MAEQRHDGSDHKEGGSGSSRQRLGCGPAPLGALCFYINQEGTQVGQTMAVQRQKHISACFVAWALLRSLRKLTNQIRHSCDQDKQEHIAELAENMDRASELHDSRTVWQRARDIAGTALGPRGRFFAPPDACQLTQSDWDHCMRATFDAQKSLHPESSPDATWTTACKDSIDRFETCFAQTTQFQVSSSRHSAT